ncbi:hypothetical protein MPSEU_000050600 [Mayamaea pseudoterrestris]|nr:hypothetical protein MPSEU_000050600 [Mayamaea pseudoterrestris]
MSLRLQNAFGLTDNPVALAFAVVAMQQQQQQQNSHGAMDSQQQQSSSEFECASLDAVLSRGVAAPGQPVKLQILPHQLSNMFHHHDTPPPLPPSMNAAAAAASSSHAASSTASAAAASTSHFHDNASASDNDDDHEEENSNNISGSYDRRMARSRERNREHARRTRLRKKAQLEHLRTKIKSLEATKQTLRQQIEECSIASILINLSGELNDPLQDEETKQLLDGNDLKSRKAASLANRSKRKRFVSDGDDDVPHPPLRLEIDGETKLIGEGKAQVNWKTGVYSDETGMHAKLSAEQLENLRRERNRMHAKMTRDRKRCYVANVQKTIDELERDVQRLQDVLARVQEIQAAATAPADDASPYMESMPEPVEVPDSHSPTSETSMEGQKFMLESANSSPELDRKLPARQTFVPPPA